MRFVIAAAIAFAALPAVASQSMSLAGDSALLKNEDAAQLLGYAAARTAEGFARYSARSPIVWARYNPGQGVGHVLVVRSTALPDGSTEVQATTFAPRDGARFANGGYGRRLTYFGGVNPFSQFDLAPDDFFRGINFTAFLASVGLVMRSSQASVAFVHYPVLTSTESVRATGGEMAWSASASASYKVEGKWLVGAPATSGDRRGFVPSYRVIGCDPSIDVRSGCRAGGFASFVTWDFGNLPGASSSYLTRTGEGEPDMRSLRAVFAGLEGYLRESSLWSDANWTGVAGLGNTNAALRNEATAQASGDLDRRDRLVGSAANSSIAGDGRFSPAPPGLWNPADIVTPDYVAKPLVEVAGGFGVIATTANWAAARDRALTQELLTRRAGVPVVQAITSDSR